MRYLLDTNILSNFTKPSPSERLVAWMAEQKDDDLYIASFTVAELWRGILEMPSGKRRRALEPGFSDLRGRRHSLPDVSCLLITRPGSYGLN